MKAAVLHQPQTPMDIRDVAIDAPKGREVLVRTAVAGVCHSDLHYCDRPKASLGGPAPAGALHSGWRWRQLAVGELAAVSVNQRANGE